MTSTRVEVKSGKSFESPSEGDTIGNGRIGGWRSRIVRLTYDRYKLDLGLCSNVEQNKYIFGIYFQPRLILQDEEFLKN